MKNICLILLSLFICACAGLPDIKGSWLDTRPPQPPLSKQGVYLGPNGEAASINAKNKAYKYWSLDGKELTLKGTDASDEQFKDFTEVYKIKKIKNGTMILEKDGKKLYFTKDESVNYKHNY